MSGLVRSSRSSTITRCGSCLLIVLFSSAAQAQTSQPTQPGRASRGLFATKRVNPASRQSIDILLTAAGGNDDDRLDGLDAGGKGRFESGGLYSDLSGAVRYRRGGSAPWLEVMAGSAGRYHPNVRHLMSMNHQLDARLRIPLWPAATLSLSPHAAYAPYYQFMLVPGMPAEEMGSFALMPGVSSGELQPITPEAPSADFIVSKRPAYSRTGSADLAQRLGKHSALSVSYDRGDVLSRNHSRDMLSEGGAARLTHRISEYVGVHAGIGVRTARYRTLSFDRSSRDVASSTTDDLSLRDDVPSAVVDVPSLLDVPSLITRDAPSPAAPVSVTNLVRTTDIDIGLDYARPLSASRRTRLNFTSGSSLTPQNGKTYYRVTGEASLTHEIGRTWNAAVRYRRELQYVELFPQPYFGDGVVISLRGQISRRLDFAASGGSSIGDFGLDTNGRGFHTYTGTMRINLSVTKHWALFSEGVYYRYGFAERPLDATFPGRLERYTARVGLKLWFPILD